MDTFLNLEPPANRLHGGRLSACSHKCEPGDQVPEHLESHLDHIVILDNFTFLLKLPILLLLKLLCASLVESLHLGYIHHLQSARRCRNPSSYQI